jgi:hypothetical protein
MKLDGCHFSASRISPAIARARVCPRASRGGHVMPHFHLRHATGCGGNKTGAPVDTLSTGLSREITRNRRRDRAPAGTRERRERAATGPRGDSRRPCGREVYRPQLHVRGQRFSTTTPQPPCGKMRFALKSRYLMPNPNSSRPARTSPLNGKRNAERNTFDEIAELARATCDNTDTGYRKRVKKAHAMHSHP